MSTENIIAISHPSVICGRLMERLHRLQEFATETKDTSLLMQAVCHETDRLLVLAMLLQTSINEQAKFRRNLREAE